MVGFNNANSIPDIRRTTTKVIDADNLEYQGLYFRLAGRYIERQTECGEYVYAHKAAKAALAFDPFNSSLNMHLTILLYQQSGAGTANAFYTGIKRHLTEAHIQRIKQTCPNMII